MVLSLRAAQSLFWILLELCNGLRIAQLVISSTLDWSVASCETGVKKGFRTTAFTQISFYWFLVISHLMNIERHLLLQGYVWHFWTAYFILV